MLSSLNDLAKGLNSEQFTSLKRVMGDSELLRKKGVFPYEYLDSFDKLAETRLPPKKLFYSRQEELTLQTRTINTPRRCAPRLGVEQ